MTTDDQGPRSPWDESIVVGDLAQPMPTASPGSRLTHPTFHLLDLAERLTVELQRSVWRPFVVRELAREILAVLDETPSVTATHDETVLLMKDGPQ